MAARLMIYPSRDIWKEQ